MDYRRRFFSDNWKRVHCRRRPLIANAWYITLSNLDIRRSTRGKRAGQHVRARARPRCTNSWQHDASSHTNTNSHIPIVVSQWRPFTAKSTRGADPGNCLEPLRLSTTIPKRELNNFSLYVLNAQSLAKPHALQQLTADLIAYDANVAVITETHLKCKHSVEAFQIGGYTSIRRDRKRRRCGGVMIYALNELNLQPWTSLTDNSDYDLVRF